MQDVRAMLAIGRRGQLGLGGRLPWEGDPRPAFRADVERFLEASRGHVLVTGRVTGDAVPDFARADRTLVVARSAERPEAVLARFPGRTVFVGGGPALWAAYAPFVTRWDITRLPYDGPADRFFDPAWLTLQGTDASERTGTGAG